MTFTPVNESSITATKETALRSTITVEKAGSCSTLIDQALATATRYRKVISPTMVAPDTADSAESPPAKSPPAKLSSAESSPTNPFPTMDLIRVTSITMHHAPITLPFQVLESLCYGFFPDRHFDSIQEAVEVAVKELTPQDQSKFMHDVYELFADIHEVSNAHVAWLSEFEENNAAWRELGYKRYYDYLRTINSSGRIGESHPNRQRYRKTKAAPSLSPSASPPNCQIPSASPVLISSVFPTEEEEKLSDFEAPTPSELLSSEDSSPERPDIPDLTPDNVTEVIDDVTEVVNNITEVVDYVIEVVDDVTEVVDDVSEFVDEDDEATSSDNEFSETGVTTTPVRTKASRKRKRAGRLSTPNLTEDSPIDTYDTVVTCSDYMERDVRYTHTVGEEERMITHHHGIYGKHGTLIVQRVINRKPDVSQTAMDQIVSGMIAIRNAII
ncbi:hypothetical protein K440DRAFT_646635 [Wilcoxina mikolae CBS 423.85]|nr:hypothetical protein K440DRAFT_646635 [Wilcoxina mikolae CBS 423.85]